MANDNIIPTYGCNPVKTLNTGTKTIAAKPAAGPLTPILDPLKDPTIIPPIIPAIKPENRGAPLAI